MIFDSASLRPSASSNIIKARANNYSIFRVEFLFYLSPSLRQGTAENFSSSCFIFYLSLSLYPKKKEETLGVGYLKSSDS